ncbi:hypothetical protein [Nocardia sp. NPDC020380]|uniref:hypothetical protein n=1 Tax=Nocardia sp. NPDC020380 TaxID=3364309 RepID=UPI003792E2DC
MIDTFTREEYEQAHHFGTAGPVSHLSEHTITAWRADGAGWNGKYWTFAPDDAGIWALHPLNLTTRNRT